MGGVVKKGVVLNVGLGILWWARCLKRAKTPDIELKNAITTATFNSKRARAGAAGINRKDNRRADIYFCNE